MHGSRKLIGVGGIGRGRLLGTVVLCGSRFLAKFLDANPLLNMGLLGVLHRSPTTDETTGGKEEHFVFLGADG